MLYLAILLYSTQANDESWPRAEAKPAGGPEIVLAILVARVRPHFRQEPNEASFREPFGFQDEDMTKSDTNQGRPASELISKRIAELGDWRGETLSRMRKLIKEADPDVVEEWKWMGTPIWSHDGIICTGESYKKVVKLTFAKGAALKDPAGLFNSSLDGNVRRAIDLPEGVDVDASAFKALVREAVALNGSGKSKPSKKAKS
jgi:hypothetical protein